MLINGELQEQINRSLILKIQELCKRELEGSNSENFEGCKYCYSYSSKVDERFSPGPHVSVQIRNDDQNLAL